MMSQPAPYFLKPASVRSVMLQICAALLPAVLVYASLVTPAVLLQMLLATLAALASEAAMLRVQGRPLGMFLGDGSAILTAWLIALAFPPLAPWWLVVTGTVFAIVVAKHLYGGLGQNPFNPAMVAYAVCIVAFPSLMSQWPVAGLDLSAMDQFRIVLGAPGVPDAMAGATPLDALKTALSRSSGQSVGDILADGNIFGQLGGRHWEWVSLCYLLGGIFLLQRRLITWHIPLAFLAALILLSGGLWLHDASRFASPVYHLFSGASLLGAFFIATDPVSACTTPRGKLIFGAGAGILTYLIRVFGGYPDGVAFAVLLLNLCAPLIDHLTQPPIFGQKGK